MDKKLVSLVAVFMLFFAAFITLTFLSSSENRPEIRAQNCNPSASKSVVFANPLEISGTQRSIISVFVRNDEGTACPGQQVAINATSGALNPQQVTTDADGSAAFQLNCTDQGVINISAIVNSAITLDQNLTVACN